MDTLKPSESQPRKIGTSQREDPSPLSRGGRRWHRGTKRKRIVRRDKAAGPINPETISAPTVPIANVVTTGPLEGGNTESKLTGLGHPGHLPTGDEMRLYDVPKPLQVRREVLETSQVAGERLPAPKALPELAAKQGRSSLSRPKDENRNPTWRGELVGKSKYRRMKAKSRFSKPEQGARERPAIITQSANSSAQDYSQLASVIPHTDINKSNPHRTRSASLINKINDLFQPDREHSKKMSNLRGGPPSGRGIIHLNVTDDPKTDLHKGRNTRRVSRNHHIHDDNEPSFPISSPTSTGGPRRPRGFQPSEVVIKDTSVGEQSKNATKAPTRPKSPVANPELPQHSDAAAPREVPKSSEHTSLMIQPTTPEKTPERKPSCWARAASHIEQPAQGWDDGTQDLSRPSWMNLDAIAATQYKAPRRANMENLPPYKFPRRRGQKTAAESSSRQTAGIEKAPVQRLPESSNSPTVGNISAPRYHSHGHATKSAKNDPPNAVTHTTKHATANLPREEMRTTVPPHLRIASLRSEAKKVTTEEAKASNAAEKQLTPQPTTAANIVKTTTEEAKASDAAETQLTPQPATAATIVKTTTEEAKASDAAETQLTPQPATAAKIVKTTSTQALNIYEDTEGTATIAAMLNYEVPPQFQGSRLPSARKIQKPKAMALSSDDCEYDSTLSKVNIDEEVAAGLNAIDHDEELAIALQAESSSNIESTHQKEYDDFQASNHQAHAPQMETCGGAKDTNPVQNNTREAINQQEKQGEALAPHLKVLATTGMTAQAIGETSNIQGGPVGAQQPTPKPTILVGTVSNGTKNITNDKTIEQVQSENREASVTTAISAVKAGKQPAKNIANDKATGQVQNKNGGATATTPMSAVKAGKQPAKIITNDRPTKQGQTKNGGAIASTPMSAVNAGKQPARDGDFLHHNSELVNWDGTLAPALLGEDWADREQLEGGTPDRQAIIQAWREDNAVDTDVAGGVKLDTKSIVFQTGKAIIGGNADIFSFIDDAAHEAIPNDEEYTQVHRERTSATAIEEFKATIASKGKSTKNGESSGTGRPERRGLKREVLVLDEELLDLPSRGIEPKANFYMRPAEPGDMRQVTQIYNQWAVDTLFTVAKEPVDASYWRETYNNCQSEKFPFIVAVHMKERPSRGVKDVKRKKAETLVGFSVANQYGPKSSVYRYSAELEFYVHREHLRQGIGRTMLDRMLFTLCEGYYLIELAPFLLSKDHHPTHWCAGGRAQVHTVTINLLHSAEEDKDNIEWKMKWLRGGRNEFEVAGNVPRIGYKFLKPYVSSC